MCRFVLYLGPPVTLSSLLIEPTNSLIHQSFHSYESAEPLNGDGFGIGWYVPELSERPAVFRSRSPAWSNHNLLELSRVTRSGCILAHVRAATPELAVSELNCHPFAHGRFSFMHNGEVGGFARLRRRLLAGLSEEAFQFIGGSTDSEHIFALFLDRVAKFGQDPGVHEMAEALCEAIREVLALVKSCASDEQCYLNIAVSNGRCAVAARYTTDQPRQADSLYIDTGRRYTCAGGACRMVQPHDGRGAVIVSSERLSDDPGWQPVPVNHLVLIHEDHRATITPCNV